MMQRRRFFGLAGIGTLTASLSGFSTVRANSATAKDPGTIQHMVIFDLKHPAGSPEEKKFLADGKAILSRIPAVKEFRVLDQVSKKNDYHFGFSMFFADAATYESYNTHPDHVSFVENRWKKEVVRFLEIDFREH